MKTVTRFERNADLMAAEMDGELVMMDVSQGSYFSLNKVGSLIWNSLETPHSREALQQSVLAAFETNDAAKVTADIDHFLEDLVAHKLIREITI